MDRDKIKTKSKIVPNELGQKSKLRNFEICNLQFAICNSQAGLTLIEVLIALTILAVGLLGVAFMQVTSLSGGAFSREMVVATELGQDMLEKLRTLPYTETSEDSALASGDHPTALDVNRDLDGDGITSDLAVGVGTANVVDERGQTTGPLVYTRIWTVSNNSPTTNMKTITVTVRWLEKGTPRSITITGIMVRS